MITLSDLYFLNSGWSEYTIIKVAIGDECHYIQGRKIPNCAFSDCIVSGFAIDFVIVKEED